MNKVLEIANYQQPAVRPDNFSTRQLDILKNSMCRGLSDDDFEVFLMACSKTQLDPFMKQIYAVKRKAKKPDGTWGEAMTIQTGIDGYRLIAERSRKYAPGPEPTYVCDEKGNVLCATAYIKKLTSDGTWHLVSASAYIEEYCQTFKDKFSGEKKACGLWETMPKTMLAKCAEAQALRKAFPAEMSGVYTKEEMMQADTSMSLEQACELYELLDKCDEKYRDWVYTHVQKKYKTQKFEELPIDIYTRIKDAAKKNIIQNTETSETIEVYESKSE